ncbi:type IV secretion system DNA-binding domain-containing protein, partial [Patescibacteria group bacterium]|nr:type IV secretion system DNA-binding domain-containing protein [Patescibacteria group bacterium]
MSDGQKITYFGETDFRNQRTKFGIKNEDRSRHVYVIGKTGMGKSTLLENMAAQDILNGEGMCFMDPHGSAIDTLIDYVPPHRVQDVVYFAPFDTDYPMSFNVLESVDADKRHLVVAGLMASFKKIWVDAWSARMEYILSNTLLALLEYPNATLLGVNRMLAEKDYRNDVIKHVTDASVKAFWLDEYNKWDPRYAREAGAAIQNKIGQFTANPLIRNIVGQQTSTMDFRKIMDEKKILLVNLSKGLIGESNGNLLGGMLITKLYLAAMSRADAGPGKIEQLPNFFFFVDEFQNFANESFADILSEARKYKLNLTVAHQYVEQMEESVAAAIFGNVGTMITFRIGATDAEVFEKQFAPTFTAEDLVNLGKYQIYLSLMIDGIGSRPFSARTLPPVEKQPVSMREQLIASSRQSYAKPRSEVETSIVKWYEPVNKPEKRSFRPEVSETEKPTNNSLRSDKKSFVIAKNERDTAMSPLKKAAKELDEKEAELEMKKIVSPKLNNLLDRMSPDDVHPSSTKQIIPEVVGNIKRHDTTSDPLKKTGMVQKTSTTTIPESVSQKAAAIVDKQAEKSQRGAKEGTISSLQDVLKKALGNSPSKKTES